MKHWFWQHKWVLSAISVRAWTIPDSIFVYACACGKFKYEVVPGAFKMPDPKDADLIELEKMMKLPSGKQ